MITWTQELIMAWKEPIPPARNIAVSFKCNMLQAVQQKKHTLMTTNTKSFIYKNHLEHAKVIGLWKSKSDWNRNLSGSINGSTETARASHVNIC